MFRLGKDLNLLLTITLITCMDFELWYFMQYYQRLSSSYNENGFEPKEDKYKYYVFL